MASSCEESGPASSRDGQEDDPPAHDRVQEGAERRTESHPAGDRPEDPPQGPTPLVVGEEIAEQGQRDGDNPTRCDPGKDAPRQQLADRAGRRCTDGRHCHQDEHCEQDRTPADTVGDRTVEQRRGSIGQHIRRHEEGDSPLGRAELRSQSRNQGRDEVRLEEDQERSGRHHVHDGLAFVAGHEDHRLAGSLNLVGKLEHHPDVGRWLWLLVLRHRPNPRRAD